MIPRKIRTESFLQARVEEHGVVYVFPQWIGPIGSLREASLRDAARSLRVVHLGGY
jgi:hypothetical protein